MNQTEMDIKILRSATKLSFLVVVLSLMAACQAENKAPTAVITPTVDETDPAEPTMTPKSVATETEQPLSARTADANVDFVRAVQADDGSWTFHVTVSHPDTGWEDYADGWDVITPDGTILKQKESDPFTRLLLHPHETEQPFTRSQSNLVMPDGVTQVTVRAHDLVDGFGGQEVVIDLTAESGPNFEVQTN